MRRFVSRRAMGDFVLQCLFFGILTANAVGRNLTECFGAVRTPSKRYSIKQIADDGHSLSACSLPTTFKPSKAREVQLGYSCQDRAVVLSWKVGIGGRYSLRGYLLKVTTEADGPTEITGYLRVKVPKPKLKKHMQESFRYSCFNTTLANKISVYIWPLSSELQRGCEEKEYISLATTKENMAGKCTAKFCDCHSKVSVHGSGSEGAVSGIVTISCLTAGTVVVVDLQRDDGTIKQRWSFKWTEEQFRKVGVKAENVTTGNYFLRVRRLFPTRDTMAECTVIISDVITVDSILINGTGLASAAAQTGQPGYDFLPLIMICVSVIGLVAAIMSWLIMCRVGDGRKPRFTNAQRIYRQLKAENERKRVALIFAKDNQKHTRRVYKLQSQLLKHGVEAIVIDEASNKGMMENWVEEGERIPCRFDALLFIMSPILYELCHRNEHGLVEITEHVHAIHRLPAAVLHTLRVKPYYGAGKRPKVFVVSLDKTPRETNPTLKAFIAEHVNICHRKPIFLNEMPKGVNKLVKKINTQPFMNV